MLAQPRSRARRLSLLGGGVAVVVALATLARGGSASPSLLAELARVHPPRTLLPSLSVTTSYRACRVPPVPGGGVPGAECLAGGGPEVSVQQVAGLTARAAAAVRRANDPEALHAAALADLIWAGGEGKALERSIHYLQTAARLSDRPAAILGDLAAAYTLRAGRTQQPRDLLEAVEAADRAVALEPRNVAARNALALALDHLGLEAEAAAEWRAVVSLAPPGGWKDEARRRLQALAAPPAAAGPPPADAGDAQLAAWARDDPQAAEAAAWVELLGGWGDAAARGDGAAAGEKLRRAELLGRELARGGGDAGVADAVRAIRARQGDPEGVRALARAHRDYAAAARAADALDYRGAERLLRGAYPGTAASPVLRGWVQVSLGVAQVYNLEPERGTRTFRTLLARVDTLRYPSLAGRVRWTLANTLQRPGGYEASLPLLAEAERFYARSGHAEHRAVMLVLQGTARQGLGQEGETYRSIYAALAALRGNRRSEWRHSLLVELAGRAAADGLFRAALRVAGEDVAAVARTRKVEFATEAWLQRAALRQATGDTAGVRSDLERSRAAVAALDTGYARRYLDASLRMVDARRRLAADPAGAEAELDAVVDGAAGVHARLLPALFARAEGRLAAGRRAAAEADLHRALALLDGERSEVSRVQLRASLMDAGRRVVDRAVMLALAEGQVRHALADLELSRASLAPVGPRRRGGEAGTLAAPAGAVAVEYALVGDTLLAWTLVDSVAVLARRVVGAAWLERTVVQARTALELRDGRAAEPALEALDQVLIGPVRAHLGAPGTPLVVVADGALAQVPFAALRERATGRFLVQDHALRFALSVRDAALPAGESLPPDGPALLVDPAFDPREFPALERLAGAAAEVREVARQYPRSTVLAGAAATRRALLDRLAGAAVMHYAGHALVDEQRPERSYLVLAGGGGPARLTAAEVGEMDLRRVRLVVLSACETLRGEGRPSGGLDGVAGAFLAAGAGGTVGSLWRVDDRRTRALMVAFHRAYRASPDGAEALQAAQLEMLRSPDAELRSPSAWAGFRYTGR